jgi:hypothetical protein
MARIIVTGYMIRHPLAGNILAYLQYVAGFDRLGHEVLYLEESGWADSCYDPRTGYYGSDPTPGLGIAGQVLCQYGARVPLCYVDRESGRIDGLSWEEVKSALREADLLLNVGGVCWLPEFLLCRRRVLLDMDPLFTQVGRFGMEGLAEYHAYFTYGVNVGRPGCAVPTLGIDWQPTVPPVIPDAWEPLRASEGPFTTIANWSAYGGVTYAGERYGQKDEEFLRVIGLPELAAWPLELALSGAPADVQQQFREAGWMIRNAGDVSTDLGAYRSYIQESRGEFSVAKNAYVKSRSGWFSDRTVCYLAAGRPAVLQDTGFSDYLPPNDGVVPFSSLQEAADGIDRVNDSYEAHSRAARELAETLFDYRRVLPRLAAIGLEDGLTSASVDRGA